MSICVYAYGKGEMCKTQRKGAKRQVHFLKDFEKLSATESEWRPESEGVTCVCTWVMDRAPGVSVWQRYSAGGKVKGIKDKAGVNKSRGKAGSCCLMHFTGQHCVFSEQISFRQFWNLKIIIKKYFLYRMWSGDMLLFFTVQIGPG